MGLPMQGPERGYAEITHDTRRVGEVITELNQLNTDVVNKDVSQDAAIAANAAAISGISGSLSTTYAISPHHTYAETAVGDGSNVFQYINNGTFQMIDTVGSIISNNGGSFSGSYWNVPVSGVYVTTALVRVYDGMSINFQFGLGVGTFTGDGAHFQWNKYFTGAGGRCSFSYQRYMQVGSGNQLRLYCWQDTGGSLALTRAAWTIWRIG